MMANNKEGAMHEGTIALRPDRLKPFDDVGHFQRLGLPFKEVATDYGYAQAFSVADIARFARKPVAEVTERLANLKLLDLFKDRVGMTDAAGLLQIVHDRPEVDAVYAGIRGYESNRIRAEDLWPLVRYRNPLTWLKGDSIEKLDLFAFAVLVKALEDQSDFVDWDSYLTDKSCKLVRKLGKVAEREFPATMDGLREADLDELMTLVRAGFCGVSVQSEDDTALSQGGENALILIETQRTGLHVDFDPETREVRGLLCKCCIQKVRSWEAQGASR
jgi:hypothetical protein